MKASPVAEAFIAAIDLFKATIEDSKESAFSFVVAVAMVLAAALALAGGAALVIAGVYMLLMAVLPQFAVALITGVVALAISGLMFWIASYKAGTW